MASRYFTNRQLSWTSSPKKLARTACLHDLMRFLLNSGLKRVQRSCSKSLHMVMRCMMFSSPLPQRRHFAGIEGRSQGAK